MNQNCEVWWLNPAWVFCGLGGLAAIAAEIVPDQTYRDLWRTPKYFDQHAFLLILLCLLFFGLGSLLPGLRPRGWLRCSRGQQRPELAVNALLWFYRVSLSLCMFGYLVWAGMALKRGITLSVFMALVSGGHSVSAELIREKYLGNLTGITTATQFGVASAVLSAVIVVQHGWRPVRLSLPLLFGAAIFRAMLNSERLAVIEIAIPFLAVFTQFIVIPYMSTRPLLKKALLGLPAGAVVVLYLLFSFFEYFRSWVTYYAGGDHPFWELTAYRLAGYYVTALNNGALILTRTGPPSYLPRLLVYFLWRIPFVSDVTMLILGTPLPGEDYRNMLVQSANPEFNNPDGLLVPLFDLGTSGGLLYWLATGVLCALLHRSFRTGGTWGLCLYPVALLGLMDVTRGIYWTSGRAIPGIVFLIDKRSPASYASESNREGVR